MLGTIKPSYLTYEGFFFICILYVGIDIIRHIWYNGTQYHENMILDRPINQTRWEKTR